MLHPLGLSGTLRTLAPPKESLLRTSALFAIALLAAAATACDDTARGVEQDTVDVKQHLEMRAAEAGAEADEEVREFRRESQATLAAMDQKLDRLERAVEQSSAEAKISAQSELRDLQRERDEVARKLEAAGSKTKAEWHATEREIDRRLAQLGKDINRALDHAGDKTEEALE